MSGFSNVTSMLSRGPQQPYLGGNRNKHRVFAKAETYGVRIRKSNLPPSMTNPNKQSQASTNVSTHPAKKERERKNREDTCEKVIMSLETEVFQDTNHPPFEFDPNNYDTRNSQGNAMFQDNSSKSIPTMRQSTYLGKRPAVDNSLRTSIAGKNVSKYVDKTLPKISEKSVKSEEIKPGTVPRPRTIFKIGKTGYKEHDFGEGVVGSRKNLAAN